MRQAGGDTSLELLLAICCFDEAQRVCSGSQHMILLKC